MARHSTASFRLGGWGKAVVCLEQWERAKGDLDATGLFDLRNEVDKQPAPLNGADPKGDLPSEAGDLLVDTALPSHFSTRKTLLHGS
ncbi:hypothetical protein ETC03_03775 [Geobacillus sp. MMMUD3]|nr:hypothetical protein [Geobacillus sp. MMMUD3]